MFWGLIMEPNKRYTLVVEKSFHISQAAMDTSTGDNDPCQVMVVVDGKNFLVATLQKNKNIQVPLDLYFKTGNSIAFLTNGKCNVHLTGYLDPEFEDEEEDDAEEEQEEEEEEPALVPIKNKRKLETKNDNTANKKPKHEKKTAKKAAEEDSSDSDEDQDQLQKFLDGEEIDTDENDESFKVNTSAEADSDDDDSDDDDDDDGEAEEDGEEEAEEQDSSEEADTTLDTSKDDSKTDVDMSKLSKNQKRRLKKKLAQQAKEQPQMNGVDKSKKEKPEAKADKKKPEAKADKKKPEGKKAEAQEPAEKKEKKGLTGGVNIEDTKVGSGPVAKPGKVVMVYYEGRLKSNNKMFDNCLKGPGFKFRLGAKEVISGWDVGINGMKVGGKRRIVCPPVMAYGAKGSPPVIPPNSTLVFDVELKNVK